MNAEGKKTTMDIAEEIRQGYRDGSIARQASTMIRERGMEREDAEREILATMLRPLCS